MHLFPYTLFESHSYIILTTRAATLQLCKVLRSSSSKCDRKPISSIISHNRSFLTELNALAKSNER